MHLTPSYHDLIKVDRIKFETYFKECLCDVELARAEEMKCDCSLQNLLCCL